MSTEKRKKENFHFRSNHFKMFLINVLSICIMFRRSTQASSCGMLILFGLCTLGSPIIFPYFTHLFRYRAIQSVVDSPKFTLTLGSLHALTCEKANTPFLNGMSCVVWISYNTPSAVIIMMHYKNKFKIIL